MLKKYIYTYTYYIRNRNTLVIISAIMPIINTSKVMDSKI